MDPFTYTWVDGADEMRQRLADFRVHKVTATCDQWFHCHIISCCYHRLDSRKWNQLGMTISEHTGAAPTGESFSPYRQLNYRQEEMAQVVFWKVSAKLATAGLVRFGPQSELNH